MYRLDDVLAADPTNGNATMCMGLVYYGLKKFDKAVEMFSRTLDISPQHKNALFNLAMTYKQLSNFSAAAKYFNMLLTIFPDHLRATLELGGCYMRMKEREKAREIYEEVLRKDPANKVALNNLGKRGMKTFLAFDQNWSRGRFMKMLRTIALATVSHFCMGLHRSLMLKMVICRTNCL